MYKDGSYYYTQTMGNRLVLWKTNSLANLKTAQQKTVFSPPKGTGYSHQLWAPELHFIYNKWYLYFAADSGRNQSHRIWVLENAAKDPLQGDWKLKGKVTDASDKWAIDASVFTHKGKWYMLWSGWEGDVNGQQNIYIAKLKNPWTIEGKRVRISSPTLDWETHGDLHDADNPPHVSVNEGPEFLQHGEKVFVVYSASGCWTDFYALGLLSADANSNLLDSLSWHKSPQPVFQQSVDNGVYAPGHNSFFTSPDGRQNWILYHANEAPGQGCGGHRSPRAQPFGWNDDGTPDFGLPVKTGEPLSVPSVKTPKPRKQTTVVH
ncbi:MAG TPA: glycoside hydrolase family 43 protein [Flavisolibacter sp.]|nr:glycoside hydrolase family 43 protein [Flavisolibacter sp.]